MTTEQLLDNALNYIYELVEQEDWICCALLEIPEEEKVCEETCDNLCKDCIKRYLKHYKKEEAIKIQDEFGDYILK